MNAKRVVLGGLLAGLVFILIEAALEPLLGSQMEQFFARLGLAAPGEGAMVGLAASMFVLGILSVWLYAAIEPRYGPGNVTALRAGTAAWALSCLLPNVALYAFGVLVGPLFWIITICPLVESVLATLAGAWAYRRGPSRSPDLAAARA